MVKHILKVEYIEKGINPPYTWADTPEDLLEIVTLAIKAGSIKSLTVKQEKK